VSSLMRADEARGAPIPVRDDKWKVVQ